MNVVTCNINLGFVTLYLNANILINLTVFVFYDYCFNISLIGGLFREGMRLTSSTCMLRSSSWNLFLDITIPNHG